MGLEAARNRRLRRATPRSGLALGLGALIALAGCTDPEEILPGERLSVRDVLETRVDPLAEEPDTTGARAIALGTAQANASWPQSGVSPFARVSHAALSSAPALAWSVDIGQGDSRRKRLNVNPVMGGNAIFTVDADHIVRAVSTGGALLWSHDLTPTRDEAFQGQGGGLAYADGRLYVASGFGKVSALDASSGAEIWSQRLGSTATGAPTVSGGVVYLTAGDSTGWAIEADDGRVRWQIEGTGDVNNVAGAPAPALGAQRVVFAFGGGSVQGAFREGGLQLWNADILGRRNGIALATIDDVTGDPLISGDTVFAGTHSGRTVALNLYDGDRLWTAREGALGPLWPVGDSVFFVSDRNQLIRLDAGTGAEIWKVALPGYKPSARPNRRRDESFANHGPILAGGRLWVASSDGLLRGFSPEDGSLAVSVEIPRGATTRPIVAGGTLYVVATDGVLHAFR
ncbi:PQQ-like beta-propeller repeat protein [Cognatishimia sp. F0-27]|uniref:PQQ-like beta-propeller repeat protein n=1 Tax=Cognatishimia sp. F0-27 TaxID=2816855 RepID=UPI001D0C8507|nr:PQQ-like beta-propeller repeat protein [Cognatishimia sp. F0-27]MCC1491594.1 PQQ-binding-like beta-propeller repeat protein [Cognatishimia sp. F0-27]